MAEANLTQLSLARGKHGILRHNESNGGVGMLIGSHPSGLSVMLRYDGKAYVYQAKYGQGRHKYFEVAKRLAVIDSYPRDHQPGNCHEELLQWSWRDREA